MEGKRPTSIMESSGTRIKRLGLIDQTGEADEGAVESAVEEWREACPGVSIHRWNIEDNAAESNRQDEDWKNTTS
jgi:hypothetical protein